MRSHSLPFASLRSALESCFADINQKKADAVCRTILGSLRAGDAAPLNALFSPYAKERASDLPQGIAELLQRYQGKTFTVASGQSDVSDFWGRGRRSCKITGKYTLLDEKKDRFRLVFVVWRKNEKEPSQVGVSLVIFIPYEDPPADEHLQTIARVYGTGRCGVYWSGWDA